MSPEVACAAGVSSEEVASLLAAAAQAHDEFQSAFQAIDAATSNARTSLNSLRSRAKLSPDPALETDIQAAESELAGCVTSHTALLQTAFNGVVSALPEPTRAALATLRSNMKRDVPIELKAALHTETEWQSILDALRHVQSRTACGLSPRSDKVAVVASAAADSAVSTARANLNANLPGVRAAWEAAELP